MADQGAESQYNEYKACVNDPKADISKKKCKMQRDVEMLMSDFKRDRVVTADQHATII